MIQLRLLLIFILISPTLMTLIFSELFPSENAQWQLTFLLNMGFVALCATASKVSKKLGYGVFFFYFIFTLFAQFCQAFGTWFWHMPMTLSLFNYYQIDILRTHFFTFGLLIISGYLIIFYLIWKLSIFTVNNLNHLFKVRIIIPLFIIICILSYDFFIAQNGKRYFRTRDSIQRISREYYEPNFDFLIATHHLFYNEPGSINAKAVLATNNLSAFSPKRTGDQNVILIVVESTFIEHLSYVGYHRKTSPYLDSLVRSKEFLTPTNTFSGCTFSSCSIATILSGQTWQRQFIGIPKISDYLSKMGYHTYYNLSGNHSNTWYQQRNYYGAIDDFSFGKSAEFAEFDDRSLLFRLKSAEFPNDRPSFIFFYVGSPHQASPLFRPKVFSDKKDANLIDLYDDKIHQMDWVVEQIVSILKSKNMWENSIVIITSDHGEEVLPNKNLGHGLAPYVLSQVKVPILIKADHQKMKTKISMASHLDILPTILDLLDKTIPENITGQSLLRQRTKPIIMFGNHIYGMTDLDNHSVYIDEKELKECDTQKKIPRAKSPEYLSSSKKSKLCELITD